ncbi:MAG: hypothetical protein NTZ38_02365, partial [Candidatus Taylorbacteria bacterium]|nr:hypothetical protein [Candidatus Taylorbacteria bacterium]
MTTFAWPPAPKPMTFSIANPHVTALVLNYFAQSDREKQEEVCYSSFCLDHGLLRSENELED